MSTPDFFRSRLEFMVDPRHALVVLAKRLPWEGIEAALAAKFVRQDRAARHEVTTDLLGDEQALEFGGGVSNAGRPTGRCPIIAMHSSTLPST